MGADKGVAGDERGRLARQGQGTLFEELEQRFKHPRLLGLAAVWVGGVFPGVSSAYILLHSPGLLLLIMYAVFLVSLGLMVGISLFDRRR
jgi:hypothetical protein